MRWCLIEDVVYILEKCIDKIDDLQRRIELMPSRMRARLCWLHRELEELRALVVKIYHGMDGGVCVTVYDYVGRRELASYGIRDEYVKDIETWIALPVMHIDKRNEMTYFAQRRMR